MSPAAHFSISSSPALPVEAHTRPEMLEFLCCSELYPAGEGKRDIVKGRVSTAPSWLPRHQEIREKDFIKLAVSINHFNMRYH